MAVNFVTNAPAGIWVSHNQDGSFIDTNYPKHPYQPTYTPLTGHMLLNYLVLGCLMAIISILTLGF